MSRNLSVSALLVSRRVVISFSRVFWAALASVLDCLYLDCGEGYGQRVRGMEMSDCVYLPLVHLETQAFRLFSQRALALLGGIDILLQLLLELLAGLSELCELRLKSLVLRLVPGEGILGGGLARGRGWWFSHGERL
ncbi:hypothetical protein F5X68DRAFT_199288 [Plectosphaerella plurivora]|uniref:Uncharacterized protein n=1 Tax=Plectosphaerella plurivora TaxID=936078 RepID=A0A9P8VI56_9PEZI|nr:hypothetical protein F5X68DRAFT_199288 [Plectosphaerella plurivora]